MGVSGFNTCSGLVPYWLFQSACCSTAKYVNHLKGRHWAGLIKRRV